MVAHEELWLRAEGLIWQTPTLVFHYKSKNKFRYLNIVSPYEHVGRSDYVKCCLGVLEILQRSIGVIKWKLIIIKKVYVT